MSDDKTCKTCRHWENVNLGRCTYTAPPVVQKLFRALASDPGVSIDYVQILNSEMRSNVDDYCDEHSER